MAVHRISDRAELLLQRMAASERKKPARFLNDLIIDYAAGLTFEKAPAPDGIPPHRSDAPSPADGDVEANDEP